MRYLRWFLIVALAAVLDRVLKNLAVSGVDRSWWIAHFTLFKNDHLVFSLPLPNVIGTVLMVLALVVVLWLFIPAWQQHDQLRVFATGLIVLGAVSNLFDRVRYGFVIDWAFLGRWWPVFNLADVMIAVGLVIVLWKQTQLDKKPDVT